MGASLYDYLGQHPEDATVFNQFMTANTVRVVRAIVDVYDFTPFGRVCDIGGGHGLLLKSILAANPHLSGVLYDQESVVKNHVLGDMAQRVEIQTGSFFERVPSADVLLMKNILHACTDDKCQLILRHCRQAMQPSSRLLAIEMVVASPTDFMTAFYDLQMQVLFGGKERTENEFGSLLQGAGLKLRRIIPTESPVKIVEASL